MTKEDFINKVDKHGDSVITYRSVNSNKQKYNVCTRDFTTPYIKDKKNRSVESDDNVLLFCWDTNSYRFIRPASVISIVPLSVILKNG